MWWAEHDTEISKALGQFSLRQTLNQALEAYAFIEKSWDPSSFKLCPWWVWKEIGDPVFIDQPRVLHLNLIGLTLFGLGIEPDPEADLAFVRPPSALLEDKENELEALYDTVPQLRLRCYRRLAAIDLIRTGWHLDYAVRLWYGGGEYMRRRHNNMPDPRRPTTRCSFTDESCTRPDLLIRRVYDLVTDHRMRGL